ncbi:MAG: NAD(P)H-dependent glycerol-3-phosphate dehydrogenase [Alphaproteobacteria bacterium]
MRVGVVGAGAWGTALALAACRAGHGALLWAHEAETVAALRTERESRYLTGVPLPTAIEATGDLRDIGGTDLVLLAAPAQHLRAVCRRAAPSWRPGVPAVICAKGIEEGTEALLGDVVASALPGVPWLVLSGPTFAREVAQDLPAAATVAAHDAALAADIAVALGSRRFRLYSSADPVGVQVGGAVKNVIAIAAGAVAGRRLGDNARAALITRGLAEMGRLAAALGAEPRTLMGLAGLGDLTLTCSAMQSRNFSLGAALGEGRRLDAILGERRSVAEGVWTARSVAALARRIGVDMPICFAVEQVLHRDVALEDTIDALLSRPFVAE